MKTVLSNRAFLRSGFTLVELLAVIAIIGILGTIILASIDRVKSKARTAQSISNLREIHRAGMLYANENDGRIATYAWQKEFLPYIPNAHDMHIFVSPNAKIPVTHPHNPNTYSINLSLAGSMGRPLNQVKRPSEIVMFFDGVQSDRDSLKGCSANTMYRPWAMPTNNPELDDLLPGDTTEEGHEHFGKIAYRNNGRAAIVFVDGHVEMVDPFTLRFENTLSTR